MIALVFFFSFFFFRFDFIFPYFCFLPIVLKYNQIVLQNEAFNKPYTVTRTTINSGDIDMSGISIDCNAIVSYKNSIASKNKKENKSFP